MAPCVARISAATVLLRLVKRPLYFTTANFNYQGYHSLHKNILSSLHWIQYERVKCKGQLQAAIADMTNYDSSHVASRDLATQFTQRQVKINRSAKGLGKQPYPHVGKYYFYK